MLGVVIRCCNIFTYTYYVHDRVANDDDDDEEEEDNDDDANDDGDDGDDLCDNDDEDDGDDYVIMKVMNKIAYLLQRM